MTLGILAAGVADAHSKSYTGWDDAFNVSIPQCPLHDFDVFVGIVCYRGGHITPNANGQATISITDSITSPLSGFVCQDLDADDLCGEGGQLELSVQFCGSATITDVAHGDVWVPQAPLLIFIDGPLFGNLLASSCGTTYSGGFAGTVDHS